MPQVVIAIGLPPEDDGRNMCEKCEEGERCRCECEVADFYQDSYGTGFCTQCGCHKEPGSGSAIISYLFQ